MAKKSARPAGPANETPAPAAITAGVGSAPQPEAAQAGAAVPAPTVEAPAPPPALATSTEGAGPTPAAEFVVVRSRVPRHRRAGRLFTPQDVLIPREQLTDAELTALQGDPDLQVAFGS